MGFDGYQLSCGRFEIDEVEVTGVPDVIILKGLATGVKNATRTRRSDQHENKTLSQVVKKVAERNGFTVAGNIADFGQIARETQHMETDLGFLKRLADTDGTYFPFADL